MTRATRFAFAIALSVCAIVACGGQVSRRTGELDHPDAGRSADGGGGSPSDASVGGSGEDGAVGPSCATDADCTAYPTKPAPPLSTTFPTTCFASDLGLLETRLAPPAGRSGFGQAVVLNGNRLAVGVGMDGVQTYRGDGLTWNEEMFVALPEPERDSVQSMAMSGDTLLVGSPSNSEAGNQAGAAYVFHLGASAATLERKLLPDPGAANLRFGSSVALDGQTAAVGAGNTVVLFDGSTGSWLESQRLVPDIPPLADPLSVIVTVALRGDLLAAGVSWSLPKSNSAGGAVFLYTRTAGVFEPGPRIDPGPSVSSSSGTPVLGEGLLVVGADPPLVYSSSSAGWALEARLGSGGASQTAIDGTQIAVVTGPGVQLFERAGGAWPVTQTVVPHDVAARGLYGPVALLGGVLAVGAPGSDGSGVGAGAVYTYAKATASSSPNCASSTKGPARIDGAGTACVDPGSGAARCPYVAAGTSTVAGMTPYGAIALPFAWTDLTDGFSPSSTLEVSSVAPRRDGTSPKLTFTLRPGEPPVVGQSIQTTFTLELCTRSVAVDGVVRLDEAVTDQSGDAAPLVGSIVIDHDGWAVKGSFHTDTLCAVFGSGP